MSVQAAVYATSRPVAPTAVLFSRSGDEPAPEASGTLGASPAADTKEVGPLERYINPTMTYNAEAGRLVMLFRDAETGEVVDQIPSESAVRQYEETLRKQERVAREAQRKAQQGHGSEGGSEGPPPGTGFNESGPSLTLDLSSAAAPAIAGDSNSGAGAGATTTAGTGSSGPDGTRITMGAHFNLVV